MLAAGCALKSRFWCTTQQKVRLKLAFLTPQKKALFLNTALQDGSEQREEQRQRGKPDGVPGGLPSCGVL